MARDFILEIGTEELPPSCMEEGSLQLGSTLENNLQNSRIKFESLQTYVSPRRITAYIKDMSDHQDSLFKTVIGPPKNIAFDKSGEPKQAARGFARSLGLEVSQLEEIEISGKGVYLGKKITEKGMNTERVLPEILKNTILSLTFKKQMYWGDYDIRFIRPIRWVTAVFGSKVIEFSIGTVRSSNITYGLRTMNPAPIFISRANKYFDLLKTMGKVIVDPDERRDLILKEVKRLEEETWNGSYRVILNQELLKDVVNLVEQPHIIIGSFPEKFLYIPRDILIEAIQYHQKYFAVVSEKGEVATDFIIVANGIKNNDKIRRGNERVLSARLSDATFFYEEDRKHGFSDWQKKLDGVIFYAGLGSMGDKQKRLEKLVKYLADSIREKPDLKDKNFIIDLERASSYCKCDLVTNMVVEFPELQGIVGREYALEKGEDNQVAAAIFEHYQPRFAGDDLPRSETGRILSLADKIDTLAGMFLAGNIPSGSEDPFALRRKASGMVHSTLEAKYDYDLEGLIEKSMELYLSSFDFDNIEKEKTALKIREFIIARYRFMLSKQEKKLDILDAVLGSGCSSIVDIDARYKAIEKFMEDRDISGVYLPMFRSKNITAKKKFGKIDMELFSEEYEKKLYQALLQKEKEIGNHLKTGNYSAVMEALEDFGSIVDTFFDKVLVMDPEEKIMKNRINLVRKVVELYLGMADFSKLVIASGEI